MWILKYLDVRSLLFQYKIQLKRDGFRYKGCIFPGVVNWIFSSYRSVRQNSVSQNFPKGVINIDLFPYSNFSQFANTGCNSSIKVSINNLQLVLECPKKNVELRSSKVPLIWNCKKCFKWCFILITEGFSPSKPGWFVFSRSLTKTNS